MFRARDTKVGRTVALKFMSAEMFPDAATRAAFFEDARAAMALSHPNIATLFDVGEYEGDCYLAYEFASGITLRQECEGRSVNPRRVVELTVQIADALAEGHGYGILHGDLRPDTIIVTHKGSAKLLEFGMSRWTTADGSAREAARAPRSLGPSGLRRQLYVAGAGARRRDRCAHRHLFARCDRVRDADRPQSIRGGDAADTAINVIGRRIPACARAVDVAGRSRRAHHAINVQGD